MRPLSAISIVSSSMLQREEYHANDNCLDEANDAGLSARRGITLERILNGVLTLADLEAGLKDILIDSIHNCPLLDHQLRHFFVKLSQIVYLLNYLGHLFISVGEVGIILLVIALLEHDFLLQVVGCDILLVFASFHFDHFVKVLFLK